MFWTAILLGGLASAFAQLGALSVTVTYLTIALKTALLLLMAIAAIATAKYFTGLKA